MRPGEIFNRVKARAQMESGGDVNVVFGFADKFYRTNQGHTQGNRIVMRPADDMTSLTDQTFSGNDLAATVYDAYDFYCWGIDPAKRGSLYDCERCLDIADIVIRALLTYSKERFALLGGRWDEEPRDNHPGHQYVLSIGAKRDIDAYTTNPNGPATDIGTDFGEMKIAKIPFTLEVRRGTL